MQHALWNGQPATIQDGAILIIDDSPVVRKILEVCFSRAGLSWVSFPDGAQALAALKQPFVPSAIVLDIHLPDMDGLAIVRLLRSNKSFDETAIIILTGYDSFLSRLRAKRAGVDCFLSKPFRVTDLLATISRYARKGEAYAGPTNA